MIIRLVLILLPLQFHHLILAQRTIDIGGIFAENNENVVNAFQNAIQMVNMYNEVLRLRGNVVTVDTSDSFAVQRATCDLVSKNVGAIFGPNSPKASGIVSAISKQLKIPHFTANWLPIDVDYFNGTDSFTRNMFPNANLFGNALYDIVKSFQWRTFAVIYDSSENLLRLQNAFSMTMDVNTFNKPKITFYKVPDDSNDYKPMLKSISKLGINQVLIDCSLKNTYSLLEQSIGVNMMNEYVNYLLVGMDSYTIDLSTLDDKSANITTIRLVNPSRVDVINTVYEFRTRNRFFKSSDTNQLTTEAALIQDAVSVFAKAFGENSRFIENFQMSGTTCERYTFDGYDPGSSGQDLLDKVDSNNVEGMTAEIHFDENGIRDRFYIEVLELSRNDETPDVYQKLATYDTTDRIQLLRNFSDFSDQTQQSIQNKVFKVIMHEGMPFLRKKKFISAAENNTENDKYEGFAKDLIDEIAKKCGFRYEIIIGGEYGKENPVTKEWNGIIGEIVNKRADLAIGDITMTHARKKAIDFSAPFMTLGISILYAKPHKEKPGLFSFMAPLSIQVWLYMATAFLCISIAEFLLAKITDNDWENPHPCDENPEELENIWNMHNCIWLTTGSIMQQGCDILPKGVPTRLAAAVWWFFALIVISSYTANLAAFLTKEQMEASIESVDDLANQAQIRYGLVRSGSTESFFKNSNFATYQKMWAVMEKAEPSVFLDSNAEGVEMVKSSNRNFAFLMESASLKYITHRECNLTQVGDLLDSKEYGIGMPINSPYRLKISHAILRLKEEFIIHNLTVKWWETENTDEDGNQVDCSAGEKEASDTPELDMENVGGCFLVLAVGLAIAMFLGLLEFIWLVRQVSIDEKITPYEAFKKEIVFAVEVWKIRKPVAQSSSRRSSIPSSVGSNEKLHDIHLTSMGSFKNINGF